MSCQYKVVVSCPALMTGVTADLNNEPVDMSTDDMIEFSSEDIDVEEDADGKIEIDVHVRGRKGAVVTIVVTNTTTGEDIFSKSGKIGSQKNVRDTRYEIKDKKVKSGCEEA